MAMTCKKCGQLVTGKGPDMALHLRRDCPKRNAPLSAMTPPAAKTVPAVDLVALLDSLDAAAIQSEIDLLNRRVAGLSELLRVAKARNGPTTSAPPADAVQP